MRGLKLFALAAVAALLAGLLCSPAFAGPDLQELLRLLGWPETRSIEVDGKTITVSARLDRGQIVYGWPWDVPGNDWKEAPTSWQDDNNVDVGKPGREPRYLGYTAVRKELFSNDWFPSDAPNEVAPAKRQMKKLAQVGQSNDTQFSDYTWAVIRGVLGEYHNVLGFENPKDGFAFNPAFSNEFDGDALSEYFKVLSAPMPGVTGAVRHWHYRKDLGGTYYDTITVRWDAVPDFIVETVDPGVEKAKPGEAYKGKVVVRAVPDLDVFSDPLTWNLYQALYGPEVRLTKQYAIPLAVAAGGETVNVEAAKALPGVYLLKEIGEGWYEVPFTWRVPAGWSSGEMVVAAEVNSILKGVLPQDAVEYIEWSELTSANNYKAVKVPVEVEGADIAVDVVPVKSSYQISWTGGSVSPSANVRVTRKDRGTAPVSVKLTLNGPAGAKTHTFALSAGGTKVVVYRFQVSAPGSYKVSASAWPVGLKELDPGDNADSATITVTKAAPPKTGPVDKRVHSEIGS